MNEEEDRAILIVDVHRLVGSTDVLAAEEWGLLLERCLFEETLAEVGQMMGVGKDRVRLIQCEASFRIRQAYAGRTPRRHPLGLYHWKKNHAQGWAQELRELHNIVSRSWSGQGEEP